MVDSHDVTQWSTKLQSPGWDTLQRYSGLGSLARLSLATIPDSIVLSPCPLFPKLWVI